MHGISCGRSVSRIYAIARMLSFDGVGHRRISGYRESGNGGLGRSRRYFFNSTAARWGSLKLWRETTWPGEVSQYAIQCWRRKIPLSYASWTCLSNTELGERLKIPSSFSPIYLMSLSQITTILDTHQSSKGLGWNLSEPAECYPFRRHDPWVLLRAHQRR